MQVLYNSLLVFDSALMLCWEYAWSKFTQVGSPPLNLVEDGCAKQSRVEEALRLLEEMKEQGAGRPRMVAYCNQLKNCN